MVIKLKMLMFATDKVTFTKTFTLKHGQEFAIANLPAGSRYTVKETGSKGYTVLLNIPRMVKVKPNQMVLKPKIIQLKMFLSVKN